jgi:hypothetical protein
MKTKINELLSVNEILDLYSQCTDMILEVCKFTSDQQVANFIISAVQDRVLYLKQEEEE